MTDLAQQSDGAVLVLIVDNQKLVREGIAARLEPVPDLQVIGQADSCATALSAIERLAPHIVLLDVHLSDGNGLDLAKRLAISHPATFVVLHGSSNLTPEDATEAGAKAFVMKELIGDNLVETLRAVAYAGLDT